MNRYRGKALAMACGAMTMMLVGAGVADAASSPAITGHASYVTGVEAQINGVIEPAGLPTFWAFQYGTSATYGRVSAPVGPLSSMSPMSVSTLLMGLKPNTTYHFRLIAIQGSADTSGAASGFSGEDSVFTTPSSKSTLRKSRTKHKHARSHHRSRHGHKSRGHR